jgi:hypothetical protein
VKRFGLVMDDSLYSEFYRLFPDHGQRTAALRRCVRRMIQRAKLTGYMGPAQINDIADEVQKDIRRADGDG